MPDDRLEKLNASLEKLTNAVASALAAAGEMRTVAEECRDYVPESQDSIFAAYYHLGNGIAMLVEGAQAVIQRTVDKVNDETMAKLKPANQTPC